MNWSQENIENILAQVIIDDIGEDLVSSKIIKSIQVTDSRIALELVFAYPMLNQQSKYVAQIEELLQSKGWSGSVECDIATKISSHAIKGAATPIANVKNIIAVASGKGGVGKSTTSVNLALALASEGATVGILDADIYGPSQPIMLGQKEANPVSKDKKSVEPVDSYGIQSMSIGYLVDESQAMVWRGPMASGALQQLINDTRWRDLDYLIVDLPPGTGDIQLTLSQKVPVTAAVIVTTPQDIALADAKKAISMFEKVSVPVLGVVENMGTHICSSCGHEENIFGVDGGKDLANNIGVPFLGSLPLDIRIRRDTDEGKPSVVAEPDGVIAGKYRAIARKMAATLSRQDKNFKVMFPTINITND
ncbi:MAG: iron-sulfur cluster carrier protein ApbC [Pseudomonadota bacterium]